MSSTIAVVMRPRRTVGVTLTAKDGADIMALEQRSDSVHVAVQVGSRSPTSILDPKSSVLLAQQRVIAGRPGPPGPPGPPGQPGSGDGELPEIIDGGHF